MTILVTGAAGYVGSVLCRELLDNGHKVLAVDNFHKGHADALIPVVPHDSFKFEYCDVSNLSHVDRIFNSNDIRGIIHLAALVGFPACKKQPGLSRLVNIDGTKNILSCKEDIPMVFASTGSVYGKVEDKCREDSPTNPLTEYGKHKLEAEKLVVNAENTVALRFATGYGVSPCMRVNLLVNDLVYQAVKNRSFSMFEADARRTFIHVKDMAGLFHTMINRMLDGRIKSLEKVYNAGHSTSNMTKRELAEYIKSKTGCHVFYGDVGKDLDQRDYEVDYSKIEAFGFKPRYTLQNGIDELIKVTPLLQGQHRYE